jgi:TonB-dependent starch-binding outer membrane protein SusC
MRKKTIKSTGILIGFLSIFLLVGIPSVVSGKGIPGKANPTIPEKVVTGKITDGNTGNPLPGANISVKGNNGNTISDTEGNYTITVANDNALLVFSFIG